MINGTFEHILLGVVVAIVSFGVDTLKNSNNFVWILSVLMLVFVEIVQIEAHMKVYWVDMIHDLFVGIVVVFLIKYVVAKITYKIKERRNIGY